ncbi:hypothetical protein [Coxiella-like endosymbiont of Rhipicephalus sanguineus]|uniref:hypothetical protein n=1 Tax=Coxiella-like endosymbiont of Rhipicephalus sanguineus TaxID=1955402 RepID=UPI00203B2930|nr:hypothetical protein [Coxiella-like endosymbiont of Rhipicephalus sanguineus]
MRKWISKITIALFALSLIGVTTIAMPASSGQRWKISDIFFIRTTYGGQSVPILPFMENTLTIIMSKTKSVGFDVDNPTFMS